MNFTIFRKNNHYLRDILIITILISLPFCFFLYNLIPTESKYWSQGVFQLDKEIIENLDFFLWLFAVKGLTLSVLSIWFVTSNNVWKYILIIPIMTEIYKICVVYNSLHFGYNNIDYFIVESFVYSIPYIVLLYVLKIKIGFNDISMKYQLPINDEINNYLEGFSNYKMKGIREVKKELVDLRNKEKSLDKKTYLIKLIKLRESLSIK
ncbi:MAG: hypothetical protein GYB32_02895 [Algicola sp.]|nr:hypothetical protein [Algicola sp.]